MNKPIMRLTAAALALSLGAASAPALAGRGHWGHDRHYYHRGSSAGWWVGGAFALGALGTAMALSARPSYSYGYGYGYAAPAVVYSAPVYTAPVYAAPVYAAPVYAAPPVYVPPPVYVTPPPVYTAPATYSEPVPAPSSVIAYPAKGQNHAQQARDQSVCQSWAMNQSGYDPATPSRYTTSAAVDSYNRAINACLSGRGYTLG